MALNVVTYGDMVIRGRPASSVPSRVARQLADKVGIDLSAEDEIPDGPTVQDRQSGLGALQGFVVGLGIGAAYGLVRPRMGEVLRLRGGVVLGIAAMDGSDVPATALGVTDPRQWDVNGWHSDLAPHLAYGLATTVAYEAFTGRRSRRRF